MFTLRMSDLQAAGACTLDDFTAKAKDQSVLTYPNGWQESDTNRMADENPIGLMFLSAKKLIPVGFQNILVAIKKAHGDEQFDVLSAEFRKRSPKK